jgi:two-component system OmpR family sensor kinase
MEDACISPSGSADESDKDRLIEELREAVRARDEFVAIAAHELRNPMTPILMQVSSLLAATRDPRRCRPELIAPRVENLQLAVTEFVRRSTTLLDIFADHGRKPPCRARER